MAKWTKDTFHFEDPSSSASIGPSEEMPDTAIKSMQDELHKYQIQECLLPTWIPDRYAFEDIKVTETVQFLCILGVYQHADERMTIMVRENLKTREDLIEKDEEDVEVYGEEGISFYIFKNFECSISGSISRDEAIAMIQSIFKGK